MRYRPVSRSKKIQKVKRRSFSALETSAGSANQWIAELGLSNLRPPAFFRSFEELSSAEHAYPQGHTLRRAWRDVGLDGILCFENAPAAYFKSSTRSFDDDSILAIHRAVWNQGVAPLLILIGGRKIHVLSTLALPAGKPGAPVAEHDRVVEVLDRTADALAVRNLVRRIELGEVFREHNRCFDPGRRVDRQLLENLGEARKWLEGVAPTLPPATMYALLGRVIFISYLVDRKIISGSYFDACGAPKCATFLDVLNKPRAHSLLYAVFKRLQTDFNGDLFVGDLTKESKLVHKAHIEILRRFLSKEQLSTGQASLGFGTYDFRFIPIETISAIYERFLDVEQQDVRRTDGVYYTPRFLAEVVLDTAMQDGGSLLGKRVLDPSCGSGIFLVGAFNRLAEEWRGRNPKVTNLRRASALIALMRDCIFGVDKSETACRIASLSLHLAYLDQLSPRDIQLLQAKGRVLPSLVVQHPSGKPFPSDGNIVVGDFFETSSDQWPRQFDYVVGNPPWTRTKGVASSLAETWFETRNIPLPQRQLAAAFAWKAPTHLSECGVACLVLPIATLLNHQDVALQFQAAWFARFSVDLVINLSDLCFYLFDGADRPAMIARLTNKKPSPSEHFVRYVVPKADYESMRAEVLTLWDNDSAEVTLREILREARELRPPIFWKTAMWATPRGAKFIDRLREYPTLQEVYLDESIDERRRWLLGEGFNVLGKGKSVERPILRKLPFLETSALSLYTVSKRKLKKHPRSFAPRYLGKELIFRAPHLLFPHGVSREGKRFKAAYCSFDCSFEHSLRGLHAPREDEDVLRFLAAALCSPLALYFFFHTVANWGTERAKIHVEEVTRFPMPPADTAERQDILAEISAIHRRMEVEEEEELFFMSGLIEERQALLDALVYEYFEIDSAERLLIDDTVAVWIPSATPNRGSRNRATKAVPALIPSTADQRDSYVRLAIQTLTSWMREAGMGVTAGVIASPDTGLGIVTMTLASAATSRIDGERATSTSMSHALTRIQELWPEHYGSVRQLRDLKMFDGPTVYVIKPLAARYWTATAAMNDADELMRSIADAAEAVEY